MSYGNEKLDRLSAEIKSAKRIARMFPSPRHDEAVRLAIKAFGRAKSAMPSPQLDDDQLAALAIFASNNGPHWRQRLANAWSTGPRPSPMLYRLSHTHGREWLRKFKFEEAAHV